MLGVVFDVRVIPGREERHAGDVESVIRPRAEAHPGFLSGQWLRALEGDALRVVHIFDTEEHATAIATETTFRGAGPRPAPVTLGGVGDAVRADRPGVAPGNISTARFSSTASRSGPDPRA